MGLNLLWALVRVSFWVLTCLFGVKFVASLRVSHVGSLDSRVFCLKVQNDALWCLRGFVFVYYFLCTFLVAFCPSSCCCFFPTVVVSSVGSSLPSSSFSSSFSGSCFVSYFLRTFPVAVSVHRTPAASSLQLTWFLLLVVLCFPLLYFNFFFFSRFCFLASA